MIRINQLKIPVTHTREELTAKAAKTLRVPTESVRDFRIIKQSLDARKKPQLFYVYTIDVTVANEDKILKKHKGNQLTKAPVQKYRFHADGTEPMKHRPLIIGSGPAGLFCAYMLARHGYRPLLLERGACVDERTRDVEAFWKSGILNTASNVQFGEGGAGTFSDGKLNTLVKDPEGRNREVLEIFAEHGAPKDICYVSKPHIGTDILSETVKRIREDIIACGGEVRFHSQVTDIAIEEGRVTGVTVNEREHISCDTLVLAIGHSARDTFELLNAKKIPMEAKAFAVGVRVEHRQSVINFSQYGTEACELLPAASYKVAEQLDNKRGVYSFCMCPGGYVVNASSEEGRLAVNGMSYHSRSGENANSAVIVTVTPEDYGCTDPLSGVAFQRELEERAYALADGRIPVQRFEDFCADRISTAFGEVTPCMKGTYAFANVRSIFPEEISASIEEGIKKFNNKICGFSHGDTLLSGVESRTSSPVRILRNEWSESRIAGLYPCGEGAGYAGGITSAAMDGIKTAEQIAAKYRPFD